MFRSVLRPVAKRQLRLSSSLRIPPFRRLQAKEWAKFLLPAVGARRRHDWRIIGCGQRWHGIDRALQVKDAGVSVAPESQRRRRMTRQSLHRLD